MPRKIKYPLYQYSKSGGLVCFDEPRRTYQVIIAKANWNAGESAHVYTFISIKKRRDLLQSAEYDISRDQFRDMYTALFNSVRVKIVGE